MTLHACIAQPDGTFRTVVDDHALAYCAPDAYIQKLALESCSNLANVVDDTHLAPFAIEAYTLGGKKTKEAAKELYARMSMEVEEQWGVDTSEWTQAVGVLQCRAAPYHNDPFNPEVAYINWYVDGPEATFELNGSTVQLKPGSLIVFDPYCPHALYYGKEYEFSTANAQDETLAKSLFVTLEVPMADVAYLLGVQKMKHATSMRMDEPGGVNPMTGQWKTDCDVLLQEPEMQI